MKTKNIFDGFLKPLVLSGFVIIICISGIRIYAQKSGNEIHAEKNKPQVSVKVHKQVDKNGNITQYDSTYSWQWSGNGKVPADVDSMMESMQGHYFSNLYFKNDTFLHMPLNDSTFFSNNMFSYENSFFDNMLKNQAKVMQNFFNEEPVLKVPDDVANPNQNVKKDSTIIKNNSKM